MRSTNICNRESGWGLLPQKILGIIEESLSGMEYEFQKGAESPVGNKI